MTSDDTKNDNVISLGGSNGAMQRHAERQTPHHIEEKVRRLEAAEVELRKKAEAAQRMEKIFEQAHAELEQRIEERAKELAAANAQLQKKAQESARLEAVFGKVMANLEQRIEERAFELLRTNYGVGTTVIDGPGRDFGIRLVDAGPSEPA